MTRWISGKKPVKPGKGDTGIELNKAGAGRKSSQSAGRRRGPVLPAGASTENMPTFELSEEDFTDGTIDILSILNKSGLAASRSEARRNVEQGGVSVDGNPVKDIKAVFSREQFAGDGVVVKRGKKNFKKIILK